MHLVLKSTGLAAAVAVGAVFLFLGGPDPRLDLSTQASATQGPPAAQEPQKPDVRYGRDIRPILSDRCYGCHGPDGGQRQADLRLDLPESAYEVRDGSAAIVPGDLEKSALWMRINSTDPDVQMPPPDSEKQPLSAEEKELFRKWIEAGAVYEPHWAFEPPVKPELPTVSNPDWARRPLDHFVLAGLDKAKLAPAEEADPATLIRRVFLDLTGLPPTVEELDAFLADTRPDAYERWVDRLLTEEPYRTRYAERMATPWLDQARYADTSGIHMDAGRSIWPWRDWVLEAYRSNMPFDQFVIEQLAGDLLPDPTLAQKVATGFHRNHVTSDEGGAINEEYLVEYAVDRVATTGSVFLGLTLGCARCHDHKFDPVTQEDFYGLYAFFNNNEEPGIYSQIPDANRALEPFMAVASPAQMAEQQRLEEAIAAAKKERDVVPPQEAQQRETFVADTLARAQVQWTTPEVVSAISAGGATLTKQPDGSVLASGANPEHDEHRLVLRTDAQGSRLVMLEALGDPSHFEGRVGRGPNGNAVLNGFVAEAVSVADPAVRKPVRFNWAWADVEQVNGDFKVVNLIQEGPHDGWAVNAHEKPGNRMAVLLAEEPFGFEGGTELHVALKYEAKYAQHVFGRVRVRVGSISDEGIAMLPEAPGSWFATGPFPGEPGAIFDKAYGPEEGGLDLSRTFDEVKLRWNLDQGLRDGVPKQLPGGPNVMYIGRRVFTPVERDLELFLGSDDGMRVFVNGIEIYANRIEREVLPDQDRLAVRLRPGRNDLVFKIVNTGGFGGFFYRVLPEESRLGHDLVAAVLPADARAGHIDETFVHAWRTTHSPVYRKITERIASIEGQLQKLKTEIPVTMVMKDRPTTRPTFVLTRGQYDLPDKDRPVQPDVPEWLGELPADAPRSRLGLAQWIVSDENPLTARVTVNRLWEQFFGVGLVETGEDFGMQGAWPSHPELLDWLAIEFRDSGWDVQAMVRAIVTSSTYRQSSRVREESLAVDPQNRLLSFYPRHRLGAEQIRDQALYVSGLLVERLGGESVKPYQPPGLWEEVSMPQSNTRVYEEGQGDDFWRRSLYTYWKRAVPPPSMLTFDAPTREFCVTRRMTTNTPLQALVLWNDEQFVEAAKELAARLIRESPDDPARIRSLVRRCTAREPTAEQMAKMIEVLEEFRARFEAAPDDATALIGVGRAPGPVDMPPEELAAWTLLANAVLSADAAISKN